jgi:anti-sigma-K factor RskA
MKHEVELKLQAWVDGELPVHEADEVARWIETDAEARALLTELKHTRAALTGFEAGLKVPESREFYWSKISRAIARETPRPVVAPPGLWPQLRRFLVPASAVAVVLLAGVLSFRTSFHPSAPYELSGLMADADAFTFTDETSGTTLVWFSFPGENELATPDNSTSF